MNPRGGVAQNTAFFSLSKFWISVCFGVKSSLVWFSWIPPWFFSLVPARRNIPARTYQLIIIGWLEMDAHAINPVLSSARAVKPVRHLHPNDSGEHTYLFVFSLGFFIIKKAEISPKTT